MLHSDYIVGPYFFDSTLTGACYDNILMNKLQVLLEDVPLATKIQMWFQHDSATMMTVEFEKH